MEEIRHHSGSRVKLKRMTKDAVSDDFLSKLREFAHRDERILAIFMFTLQAEGQAEQPSMALALKSGLFTKKDESFLDVVDEVQLMLPDDLSLNLYRFGASEFLARYLVKQVDPVYLRHAAWLDKQKKKLS